MKLAAKPIVLAFVASIILQMPAAFAEEAAAKPELTPPYFTDVQEGHLYYLPINYLFEEEIVHGYEDETYKSGNKVNRVEALKMIILAFGVGEEIPAKEEPKVETQSPETEEATEEAVKFTDLESGESTEVDTDSTLSSTVQTAITVTVQPAPKKVEFSDVDNTAWYGDFIKTAVENNLVSGYKDGSFQPGRNITLAEALKISLEADKAVIPQDLPEEIFADVPGNQWYSGYALYAKDLGILNISTKNKIDPHQEISRGKLAELIYRIQKAKEGYKFGIASYYGDQFHGRTTASGTIFDNNAMTAASRTLPFGTIVRVRTPKFDKYIDVEITDRGPYAYGRVIDLSKAAFEKIEHLGAGVTRVEYKIMTQEELDKEREELIKSAYI